MSETDILQIGLPRSDWLLVEQALLIAAVKADILEPRSERPRLWIDLLGIIGRAREAATIEHEAAIREGKLVRDREHARRNARLRKATPQP